MANTASFHLDLSDNINNMAAVQGGYPEQPPMPGGGRKKRKGKKGKKAKSMKARRGKARVSKRMSRSRSRTRTRTRSRSRSRTRTRSGGGDNEWLPSDAMVSLMKDFVRDPANRQLNLGAPRLPKPQIPKPESVCIKMEGKEIHQDDPCHEEDDAKWVEWHRKFKSSADYQTWVLETAKYYYNNGGKDMKKLFGGLQGMRAPKEYSEDLNNKVERFFKEVHGVEPSSSPTWSNLLGTIGGGNCASHSQPGGGNCASHSQPGGGNCASHSQPGGAYGKPKRGGGNCASHSQPGGGSRRRKATRRVSGKGRGRRTSMLRMKKRMSKRRGSKAKSRSRSRSKLRSR